MASKASLKTAFQKDSRQGSQRSSPRHQFWYFERSSFVTSSNCTMGRVCTHHGKPPHYIGKVCGWLDLVLVKYAHMINGFSALAVSKLGVCDTFEEIKVGMEYHLDGKQIPYFPANQELLNKVTVKYKNLHGWRCSTEEVCTFANLPTEAQAYIQFIKDYLEVPVK
ncbi:putative Adenylosuccinate synthetase protein [Naja naja]|nr:putative Adenylosuccinate synthetase protein [Naja naja]